MKKFIGAFLFILNFCNSNAQDQYLDSLQKSLLITSEDSFHVFTLLRISVFYFYSKPDTSLDYAQQALHLSKKLKFKKGEAQSLNIIGNIFFETGNYIKALETQLKVLQIQEKRKDLVGIAASYNTIARVYQEQLDYRNALNYYLKARDIFDAQKNNEYLMIADLNIGDSYEKVEGKLDSALFYQNKAFEIAIRIHDSDNIGTILTNLGNIQFKLGYYDIAISNYKASIPYVFEIDDKQTLAEANYGIAKTFEKKGNKDSSIFYAKKSLSSSKEGSYPKGIMLSTILLSGLYESLNKIDSAYAYYKVAMSTRDTMFNAEIVRKVQTLNINEQIRQQEIADNLLEEKINRKNNLQMLAIALFIIFFFAVLIFLSQRKTKNKSLKYLGLLALLLLFEFVSLFIHPFIATLTNHIPALILLISVTIAAILVPLHHRLEVWVEHKMSHRKKRVYKKKTNAVKNISP